MRREKEIYSVVKYDKRIGRLPTKIAGLVAVIDIHRVAKRAFVHFILLGGTPGFRLAESETAPFNQSDTVNYFAFDCVFLSSFLAINTHMTSVSGKPIPASIPAFRSSPAS